MVHISIPLTDIHAHVLPNVDDGPSTPEESMALADLYAQCGVSQVFCTPHYRNPAYHVSTDVAKAAFDALSPRLDARTGEGLSRFMVGAEVHLAADLVDDLRHNAVPTLGNTHYVLVEFPNSELPAHSLQWIHELKVRGYHPVMAHPERHLILRHEPKRIDELASMGVLMQLTAMCFTAQESKNPVHEFAWRLLTQGVGTVIASDTHGTTRRPPHLKAAYEAIGNRLGALVVDTLVENANAIWSDADIRPVVPTVSEPKRRWFRKQ